VSAAWFFFWQRYASINLAAPYFAVLFLVESLMLLAIGLSPGRSMMPAASRLRQRTALGIYLFALCAYPFIGMTMGRSWTQAELAGLAPDPTALATLGVLLLAGRRAFWPLAFIPIVWCLISGATLWALESRDFFVAPAVALVAAMLASLDRGERIRQTAGTPKQQSR
jgi:hypothetical protein